MSFSERLLKPGAVGLEEAGQHLMTGPGGSS